MSAGDPPAPVVRRRVVVRGRVQGVGFRASCARRAIGAGVSGYVRNCADGSVEAVFEGHVPTVDALVAWCREGPAWAQVTGLELSDEEPSGGRSFDVR